MNLNLKGNGKPLSLFKKELVLIIRRLSKGIICNLRERPSKCNHDGSVYNKRRQVADLLRLLRSFGSWSYYG